MDPRDGFKMRRIWVSEHNNVKDIFSPISISAQVFNTSERKTLNAVLKYSCTAICIFNNILLTCIHSNSQVPNLRICSELSRLYLYTIWSFVISEIHALLRKGKWETKVSENRLKRQLTFLHFIQISSLQWQRQKRQETFYIVIQQHSTLS